ncbi:hypothetical protein GCM10009798_10270 [Nocardioides panacihumi]|uniref:EccD-like transmembrane domain-containing protein n=1 Tax=Nocardioides panacihumi TaxID=400774 RepID=A0ABP5BUW4_9ACTN
MSGALLRVSVVAGARRLDVAVPPALPVAELVPTLARRLGVVSYDGLRLCTATGATLADSPGLAPQSVVDGAVLTLAPAPPPPVVHDDHAEALATAGPPREPPRWPTPAAAALLLLLGALSVAVAGETRAGAAVALLLLAGGIALGRVAPGPAVVAVTAACAYAAIAAGLLASSLRPGAGVAWAAGGGAGLATASIAMAGLPGRRLRLLPVLVVATAAAAVGAALSARSVPLGALAGVLLVTAVLTAAAVPWIAVGRISRPRGRVDAGRLADEARVARELLVGVAVGLAIVQLTVTPVVAAQGPSGIALASCASAFALLRSRHHISAAEVLPGLLAGGLGLLLTAGVALGMHEPWRPIGSLVLAGAGGVLLVAAWLVPSRRGDARGHGLLLRPALQALESACLAALLPLLVLATGALGHLR